MQRQPRVLEQRSQGSSWRKRTTKDGLNLHRFPLSRPAQAFARNLGTRWPHSSEGLRRNLSHLAWEGLTLPCPTGLSACQAGAGSWPTHLSSFCRPRGGKSRAKVIVGFTYPGEGWIHKAKGHSTQHDLQSQKIGTDVTSINRVLG